MAHDTVFKNQTYTLNRALEHAADAILVSDLESRILYVNSGFVNMTGYSFEEVVGQHIRILKSGKVNPEIYKQMWNTVLKGDVWKGEIVNRKKNGDFFNAELVVSPVKDESGNVINLIGVQRDVTKRRLLEVKLKENSNELERLVSELKKSENEYRSLIELANDGIVRIDEVGTILLWNRVAEKMFGYTSSEILGENIERVISRKYIKSLKEGLAFKEERENLADKIVEIEGRKKDGIVFPVEVSLSNEKKGDVVYFMAIIRDITNRKVMEKQLLQAEKFQYIGHLAAGIAHEVNNPLSIMEIDLSLIKDSVKEDDSIMENTMSLKYQLRRIAGIIRGMQDISRPVGSPKERVDINEVLQGHMLHIAFKELEKKNITVNLTFQENSEKVEASRSQLIQVFLNMIKNSDDSMNEKEEFLKSFRGDLDNYKKELNVSTRLLKKRSLILVEFSDTGIGINKNHLDRIFDPFFTTKGYKGTGLGLPISYNIIKNMGGDVKVDGKPMVGASFKIYLPISEA